MAGAAKGRGGEVPVHAPTGLGRCQVRERRGSGALDSTSPAGSHALSSAPTVSLSELHSLLASGSGRLFDVRSREEAAAGTIPVALNIPGMGLRGDAPVVE